MNSKILCIIISIVLLFSACDQNTALNIETDNLETFDRITVFIEFTTVVPDNLDLVVNEINKITREKINAEIDIIACPHSKRNETLQTVSLEGKSIDLMRITTYPNLYENFIPLNDYLSSYCPSVNKLFTDDELNVLKIDGKLYMAPSFSDKYTSSGIVMRKDIIDKYNIDVQNLTTLEDLDALFDFLSKKEPDMKMTSPYRTNVSFFFRDHIYDTLLNTIYNISEDTGEIINVYKTQEYNDAVHLIRKWYLNKYLPDEMVIQKVKSSDIVKTGTLFSYFCAYRPGIDVDESKSCGYEMIAIQLRPPMITNCSISRTGWGITTECKYPEKAAQFLNLLYTDSEIVNMLTYGIEGIHYCIQNDGSIDYPEDVTAEISNYNPNIGYYFLNQYLSYVWNGSDPEIWTKVKQYVDSAGVSESLGFSFDDSEVSEENNHISEIVSKYSRGLETGILDPDVYLPLMLQEIEDAGGEKVMSCIQRQYDEWKNSKEDQK